jgi:carboxymethylenebutenolidase
MGHWITLDSHDDQIRAWRADPAIPPHGALVVMQEIYGVNSNIRDVVDTFAAHGYIAIAPCVFDHIERDVELGFDNAGMTRGRELVAALGFDIALADVRAAIEQVADEAHVGIVGYSWGGTVAYLACARMGLPAVSYYGGRTVPFLHERPQAPLLLHFGETDPIIPPADVQKHRDALPMAEIHVWPAGHGFNCGQRDDFNAEVAEQVLARTLAFFGEHLR